MGINVLWGPEIRYPRVIKCKKVYSCQLITINTAVQELNTVMFGSYVRITKLTKMHTLHEESTNYRISNLYVGIVIGVLHQS